MRISHPGISSALLFALISTLYATPLEVVKKVSYDMKVVNFLAHDYAGQTREVPLCLVGKGRGGSFHVTDLRFPYIFQNSRDSARFDLCSDVSGYLGVVHNHPPNVCSPSKKDMERFSRDKEAKIESIVCGIKGDSVKIMTFFK